MTANELRSLWLDSPDSRLDYWRELRLAARDAWGDHMKSHITAMWEAAPIVTRSLDPYDPSSWPTIWELLQEGECCSLGKQLGIAYSLHFISDMKISIIVTNDPTVGMMFIPTIDDVPMHTVTGTVINNIYVDDIRKK